MFSTAMIGWEGLLGMQILDETVNGDQYSDILRQIVLLMIICKTGGWEEEAPLNGQPVSLTSQHVTIGLLLFVILFVLFYCCNLKDSLSSDSIIFPLIIIFSFLLLPSLNSSVILFEGDCVPFSHHVLKLG
ncbi:hypothetical protein L9F63_021089, partial [Diploptera punctata]